MASSMAVSGSCQSRLGAVVRTSRTRNHRQAEQCSQPVTRVSSASTIALPLDEQLPLAITSYDESRQKVMRAYLPRTYSVSIKMSYLPGSRFLHLKSLESIQNTPPVIGTICRFCASLSVRWEGKWRVKNFFSFNQEMHCRIAGDGAMLLCCERRSCLKALCTE